MSDIVHDCELYAKVIEGIIVVKTDWKPDDPERREPRETLLKAAAEIERLRKAIQDYLDGNYENPRRHRNDGGPNKGCAHGRFYWEGCENCIDDYFAGVLKPPAEGRSP